MTSGRGVGFAPANGPKVAPQAVLLPILAACPPLERAYRRHRAAKARGYRGTIHDQSFTDDHEFTPPPVSSASSSDDGEQCWAGDYDKERLFLRSAYRKLLGASSERPEDDWEGANPTHVSAAAAT